MPHTASCLSLASGSLHASEHTDGTLARIPARATALASLASHWPLEGPSSSKLTLMWSTILTLARRHPETSIYPAVGAGGTPGGPAARGKAAGSGGALGLKGCACG